MHDIKGIRVLVAFASKHGSTSEIALVIAEELRAADIKVDLHDLREKTEIENISGYDAVILGSAIYEGRWLPQAKRFGEQYKAALSSLPLWLFSSGPLGWDDPKPQDDPNKLAISIGEAKVLDHQVFVGKLDLNELGFGERLLTKLVKAPQGDFRDWEKIKGWAQEIARCLGTEASVTGSVLTK
jgi:menaquinone-dependent protoporphyrinogen oxidase